ncbi:hypothetical protein RKD30_001353 [Streptomyces pristinaespiralis]
MAAPVRVTHGTAEPEHENPRTLATRAGHGRRVHAGRSVARNDHPVRHDGPDDLLRATPASGLTTELMT